MPLAPEALADDERRIHELAVASDSHAVAEMILYTAGDAACPICGYPIKISKALGADH